MLLTADDGCCAGGGDVDDAGGFDSSTYAKRRRAWGGFPTVCQIVFGADRKQGSDGEEENSFRTAGSLREWKSGNWLTRNQAEELVNAASTTDLRGLREGAILGLLLGCGLRRSEVVGLTLDQRQTRDGHWVIVDLIGKGKRLRTVPVPSWCKQLLDGWLRHAQVSQGRVFRPISKDGKRQDAGVTANVVWYAVKRCARQAGIANLAPHDIRPRVAPVLA
jgi:integrase